jgi:hypothetical protein
MSWRGWCATLVVAAGGLAPAATGAADVAAVEPGPTGVLTKCRGWLVATSCRTYRHVALPPRIAVGDTIALAFGTHPKEYGFPVARIELRRGRCTILSEAGGDPDGIDKIEVAPCRAAPVR